jgi:hypothetical protein
MPACFQLYDKSKPEEGPVSLSKVDERCASTSRCRATRSNTSGDGSTASGCASPWARRSKQIREQIDGYLAADKQHQDGYVEFYENMLLMLSYLEERYTPNAFYSPIKD